MPSGYYLISKFTKLPYHKYDGNALRLVNQSARTVDEVIVGLRENKNIKRKITTFRDSNGNIIERVFNYSDKPFKNRIYTRSYNVIGTDEFVTSTHIKEYTLPRTMRITHLQSVAAKYKRTLFWTPIKFFTNHLSQNINTGDKILTQVIQKSLMKPQKEIHKFIEYPYIKTGKIENTPKRILEFSVNTSSGNKVNSKNVFTQRTKLPQNDSFLGLRALSINDSKEAFAQKFIIGRGLSNKRIKIDTEYLPLNNDEELITAMFDPDNGIIDFVKTYKFKTKSQVCSTARHEAEHGWQFYLHARNTKGGVTPWEGEIYNLFKDLPKSMKKEAQKYTDAINSYVTVAEDRTKYRQNYIEIKAREAGEKAKALYDYERAEIQKEFPHIPKELL